jgi:hypothetical protein
VSICAKCSAADNVWTPFSTDQDFDTTPFPTQQNSAMMDQLKAQQEQHEREVQRFLVEHEAEKKQLILRREDASDEQRHDVLCAV